MPALSRLDRVSIILSNRFCQFALLERPEAIANDAEALAYVRSRMQSLYGDPAQEWDLSFSPSARDAWLICATPLALLEEVRAVFAAPRANLLSIQPFFAAAWNRRGRARLRKEGWFVVHEPRRVVLGFVSAGRWLRFVARRTTDTLDHLLDIIDRERALLDKPTAGHVVWLYGSPSEDLPAAHRDYRVNVIPPTRCSGFEVEDKRLYAMAA